MTGTEKYNIHILTPIGTYRTDQSARSIAMLDPEKFNISLIEVVGLSEVARARNHVATAARDQVQSGDLVFWMDADMVIHPRTFERHVDLVLASRRFAPDGLAISGRYVNRRAHNRIAASHDEFDKRLNKVMADKEATLLPMMVGMGCLMMTADLFLDQMEASASGTTWREDGSVVVENLVCCPRIIVDIRATERAGSAQFAMLSEDFDYCSRIRRGAWMVRFDDGSSLDYGHVITTVAVPHGPVEIVDDRF